MHEKIFPKHGLELLNALAADRSALLRGWTLAGETGLALQLGHRVSEDFVDLFVILRGETSLSDYFALLPRKYGARRVNTYHVLRSLTYFADAEKEPLPRMLEPFDWQECKAFFVRAAHAVVLPR